jgi:hypothetical protein
VRFHAFLTSAPNGREWPILSPGKATRILNKAEGWVGTTPGLDALEKKSPFSLPGIEPRFLGSPTYILVITPTMLTALFFVRE